MADARVRRIVEDEWRELRDLRLNALADSPDSFGSTYERESSYSDEYWQEWARQAAAGTSETCVLAWKGEDAVAMVGAYVEDGSAHAKLIAMWVAPAARRRGIGERLVEAILAWATDAGLPLVRLKVAEGSIDARRLYERCGFAPTGHSGRYDDRPHIVTVELERHV